MLSYTVIKLWVNNVLCALSYMWSVLLTKKMKILVQKVSPDYISISIYRYIFVQNINESEAATCE